MPSPQRKTQMQGGPRVRSPLGGQALSEKTEHHVPVTLVSASHRVISRALHHAIDSSGDEGSDDNMHALPLAGPPVRPKEEHDASVSSSLSSVLPDSSSSNSLRTASADMLAILPASEKRSIKVGAEQTPLDKETDHRSKKRVVYAPALRARQARLKQQVEQYLHLTVVLPFASTPPLRLLTQKTATIEQLARQIEAEYALSNASPSAPSQAKETTDSVTSLNLVDTFTSNSTTFEPLEVGLLHDPNQTPLLFSSLVGQVLENNSVVHAINIARRPEAELPRFKSHAAHECHTLASQFPSEGAESDAPTPDYATARPSFHLPSMGHHEQHYQALTARLAAERQSMENQAENPSHGLFGDCRRLYFPRQAEGSTDDMAQAVLHHGLAIQHFEKFCVTRFYVEALLFFLDCELFRKSQEEMTTLVVQARYIYLTYVRPNSPLEVNIPSDVRKSVPWPIDAKNLDQSILLETQFYVYEFLRAFAIPKFVQSAEYQQMIDEMDNDPHAFAKGWLLKSLTSYYSSDPDSMLQSLTTMNETSTDMLATDVPRERRPSALGLAQKEEYLNAAIDKFWKNDRRASVTSGYFKQEHHLSTAQKNKRIRTEKKLSKFFGERPEIRILADKLQEDAEAPSEGTQHEIQALLGQMIDTTADADQPLTTRRKKLEKLEEFFGDRLGDMQLIEQRLMQQDRLHQQLKQQQLQASPTSGLSNYKQHGSKEMLRVPPVTTNDISLSDRKVLTKRVHKVQDILGQTLQEDEIKHSITNPHRAFGSTENLADRVAAPPSLTGRSRSSTMPSFLNAVGPSSPTSPSPQNARGHDLSRYRHERCQSNTTATTSDSEVASLQPGDLKEMRRRKLEKIQQFLGEMIPLTDLLDTPAKTNGSSTKEPLSETEKRHQVKRSEKLNKWFGKQPPAALQSTIARHRQSIISLSLIMQSSDTVLDLLEYLDNQEGGAEEEEDTRKTMHRRRKMNKLTRFFGDKPRGEELIEQDILNLLEQEINDEIPEKEGRSELKADLLSLRKQLKRISADITSATSAFSSHQDAKKMVMVNFPIGLPDEDEEEAPKTLQRASTGSSAPDHEQTSLVTAGGHTLGSAFQMGSTATVLIGNAPSLPEVDKSVSLYTTRSIERSPSTSPPPPQLSAVSHAMNAMMPRSFSAVSTGSTGTAATCVVPEELLTPSSSFLHNQETAADPPAFLPHVSQLRPSSSQMRERSSSASRLRSRLGL